MDPKKLFIDDRMRGICAYCGRRPNSRDHVPSKILLDKPYPDNLPIAESCLSCNNGFAPDEEYLACFIECVINGTSIPNENFRPKIIETLTNRPLIAARIENSKKLDANGNLIWIPEIERIKTVMLKLARGHIAYELGIQRLDEPEFINFFPLTMLSADDLENFYSLPSHGLFPEIGSRAFINLWSGETAFENWFTIQKDRYEYSIGQSHGDWVKIIIRNYLGCHVVWS